MFVDKAVWLEKEKILVIADLHLGYEDALREHGVFLPKMQFNKIKEDLKKIFSVLKKENMEIKEIIILGDLKHEFSGISSQEWRDVLDLVGFLSEKCEKIILVRGNHDNYLISVVKKEGIELRDFYIKGGVAFLHGHKLFFDVFDKKIKTLFLGHLHPAVSISKGVKKEIYKCFLVGKFKDKEVVILPSFFPLIEGQDVTIEDTNLAIKLDLKNFEVFVVGDEVLGFGKLKDVGKLVG